MTQNTQNTVEVLAFLKGPRPLHATVVTDGTHHRSYTLAGARKHKTLKSAIAYLEGRGYHILTDMGW